MSSTIFDALLDEKIREFATSFEQTAKQVFYDETLKMLRHPGEFGMYRETLVREFLRFFTPCRLDIHNGFLITALDSVSTQCDIVIYDAKNTPLIENGEKQRFFPVESVCAVGEVKSIMSKPELKTALNKLARSKALREQISAPTVIKRDRDGKFDPFNYAYDQLPTFLICQNFSFDFKSLHTEISGLYDDDIEIRHRHNLVLSLQDGILLYADENNGNMMFPEIMGRILPNGELSEKEILKNRFLTIQNTDNSHIKIFCSYIFLLTSSATVLYPDITSYMGKLTNTSVYTE